MRLNGNSQIKAKALDHAFGALETKLQKEEAALVMAFYKAAFGKALALIDKLPRVWWCETQEADHHSANVGGQRISLKFPKGLKVPPKYHYSSDTLFTITDEKLVARCRKWQEDSERLKKDRSQADAILTAMLNSLGAYSTLEKEWPEGKKFYQSLPTDFPGSTGLPAIQVNALNHMLGLPNHQAAV